MTTPETAGQMEAPTDFFGAIGETGPMTYLGGEGHETSSHADWSNVIRHGDRENSDTLTSYMTGAENLKAQDRERLLLWHNIGMETLMAPCNQRLGLIQRDEELIAIAWQMLEAWESSGERSAERPESDSMHVAVLPMRLSSPAEATRLRRLSLIHI